MKIAVLLNETKVMIGSFNFSAVPHVNDIVAIPTPSVGHQLNSYTVCLVVHTPTNNLIEIYVQ